MVAPMALASITDLYAEGPARVRALGIFQGGFGAPLAAAALAVAVALGVAFVMIQRRSRAPMVPLGVLADPARRVALIVMLLMGAVVGGYVYFTSLYLQKVLHFDALLTGLALIPATATVMVVSVLLTRRLLARFGTRPLTSTPRGPPGGRCRPAVAVTD
jgi:hypothetical protein